MTNSSDEEQTESTSTDHATDTEEQQVGITDEQLPEDLQPTDDNPLAQSPEDNPIGADAQEAVEED